MLGKEKERNNFQNLLKDLYKKNNIPYVEIKAKGYDDRYNIIKKIVSLYLEDGLTVNELQEVVNAEEEKINIKKGDIDE